MIRPVDPADSQRRLFLALGFWATLVAGCGTHIASNSACRNLEYQEAGPTRVQYLPCAGEMVAVMDELDPQVRAALGGDQRARSLGQASVQRLRSLMTAAGGRKLLERWSDATLTEFNVDVNNAITHYEEFYMIRILDNSSPFAAQSREAAEHAARRASTRYEDARRGYRRLK
jgi:hypothetical protein